MAQVNSFINLTSTGTIAPVGWAVLSSMYVNSTSSGVFRLWHGSTNANVGLPFANGNITPAIGYHNLGNILSTAGIFLDKISGSFDVTFHLKQTD